MTDKTMHNAVTEHLKSVDPVQAALLAGYIARELTPLASQMGGDVAGQIKHVSRIATNMGREGLESLGRDDLAGLLALAANAFGSFVENGSKALQGDGVGNILGIAKMASHHCARVKLIAFDLPDSKRSIGFNTKAFDATKDMDARLNTDVAEATAFGGYLQGMIAETLAEEYNKAGGPGGEEDKQKAQKMVDGLLRHGTLINRKLGLHELHESDGDTLLTLMATGAKAARSVETFARKHKLKQTVALARLTREHLDGFGKAETPVTEAAITARVAHLEAFRAQRAEALAAAREQAAAQAPQKDAAQTGAEKPEGDAPAKPAAAAKKPADKPGQAPNPGA